MVLTPSLYPFFETVIVTSPYTLGLFQTYGVTPMTLSSALTVAPEGFDVIVILPDGPAAEDASSRIVFLGGSLTRGAAFSFLPGFTFSFLEGFSTVSSTTFAAGAGGGAWTFFSAAGAGALGAAGCSAAEGAAGAGWLT